MDRSRPLHVRGSDGDPAGQELVTQLQALLTGAAGLEDLAGRLSLLSDPRRLKLLFCLHAHPSIRSSDLARAIDAPESTTSHALTLLREAGWVRARRSGREVRYELADPLVHEILHTLGSDHLPGVHHDDNHRHG